MTFGKLVNNLFIEKDHNRPQEPLTKSTNDRTVTRSVSTKENTVSSRGSRNIFSKKRTNQSCLTQKNNNVITLADMEQKQMNQVQEEQVKEYQNFFAAIQALSPDQHPSLINEETDEISAFKASERQEVISPDRAYETPESGNGSVSTDVIKVDNDESNDQSDDDDDMASLTDYLEGDRSSLPSVEIIASVSDLNSSPDPHKHHQSMKNACSKNIFLSPTFSCTDAKVSKVSSFNFSIKLKQAEMEDLEEAKFSSQRACTKTYLKPPMPKQSDDEDLLAEIDLIDRHQGNAAESGRLNSPEKHILENRTRLEVKSHYLDYGEFRNAYLQ